MNPGRIFWLTLHIIAALLCLCWAIDAFRRARGLHLGGVEGWADDAFWCGVGWLTGLLWNANIAFGEAPA